jgi:NADPH2:quinone reductase
LSVCKSVCGPRQVIRLKVWVGLFHGSGQHKSVDDTAEQRNGALPCLSFVSVHPRRGSVGNATYQAAKARGAAAVISTAGSSAKAAQARDHGYADVIDLSAEIIGDGVRRITDGKGVDIVIESLGGDFIGAGLSSLAVGDTLVTIGYSAGRKAGIDVTDLIWKRARMAGFALLARTPDVKRKAWEQVTALISSGAVVPIVARTYPLEQAVEALRYLHEDRPFGKVILVL